MLMLTILRATAIALLAIGGLASVDGNHRICRRGRTNLQRSVSALSASFSGQADAAPDLAATASNPSHAWPVFQVIGLLPVLRSQSRPVGAARTGASPRGPPALAS